ncbi:protein tyrosine phosphatase 1 like [Dasychira pudibunda nucleopolyhedrovirus]|nr:protein tyrosine phosphatase 1 like [Dasychira pudibunda nucleopolyhedrovirus]WHM28452.1 ptp1l [Dasychira pudibunda nucleopolyhedrovirus]
MLLLAKLRTLCLQVDGGPLYTRAQASAIVAGHGVQMACAVVAKFIHRV